LTTGGSILTPNQTTMSNPSYTSQPNTTSLPPPNFLLASQFSPCLPPNLVFLQLSTVAITESASRFPNNPNSLTFLSSSITLTNIITSITRKPKPCFTALYLPRSNHPNFLTTMHGPHPTAPNHHAPSTPSASTQPCLRHCKPPPSPTRQPLFSSFLQTACTSHHSSPPNLLKKPPGGYL